jgi:hypothetical protein
MASPQIFFKNQPCMQENPMQKEKEKDLDMKQLQRCTTWNLFIMIH